MSKWHTYKELANQRRLRYCLLLRLTLYLILPYLDIALFYFALPYTSLTG